MLHTAIESRSVSKQYVQNLVGRQRPVGAPLPTRPCVFLVSFLQWPNPCTARWATAYEWKNPVLLKCSYTKKTQNSIQWYSGSSWWISRRQSRITIRGEPLGHSSTQCTCSYFDDVSTSALHLAELSRKPNVSLYLSPRQHLDIFYWVITKGASGIIVASGPIPQLTRSNHSELMKVLPKILWGSRTSDLYILSSKQQLGMTYTTQKARVYIGERRKIDHAHKDRSWAER